MVRFIVFDFEGMFVRLVLGWVEFYKRFGIWEKGKEYVEVFFKGEIDYVMWVRLDVFFWKGYIKDEILEWVSFVEYMEGVKELIEFFKENGFKIVILSSGFMCFVKRVGEEFGVDYVYVNELIFDDEGRIIGEVNLVVDF